MKIRIIPGILPALLAVSSFAVAQEKDERGQLAQLIHWRIDPSKAMVFEGAMKKLTGAADQAGLSADYRWALVQDGFEYTLYYPVPDMAYFDDPEQFMRAFKGTPGEAALEEAFEMFTQAGVQLVSLELIEGVTSWEYEPEGSSEAENMYAKVHTFWLKPGVEEQFNALIGDFITFFKTVGHPYPIHGSRVRFGDASRVDFVEWYDSPENYYGVNNLEKRIAAQGLSEKWAELFGRLSQLITRSEDGDMQFRADLSFWPST